MNASAPVGSSVPSPRRATVPMLPYWPSIRGTSRIMRLPWRAASRAALAVSPSTASVTVMWGRTTTSSMGMTGSSSDFGIFWSPGFISSESFSPAGSFPIPPHESGRSPPPRGRRRVGVTELSGEDPRSARNRPALNPRPLPALPGHAVDGHRRQEHGARDHVLDVGGDAQEGQAVADGLDHQRPGQGRPDGPSPAEQAGAPDHGGG